VVSIARIVSLRESAAFECVDLDRSFTITSAMLARATAAIITNTFLAIECYVRIECKFDSGIEISPENGLIAINSRTPG
jgi:hypothetical protein